MSNKGRRHRGSGDHDLLDKLKQENKKLKSQVSQLRKQLSRLDLDRYQNLQDLIHKYDKLEQQEEQQALIEDLKKVWECHNCREGYLKFVPISRPDGEYYIRSCTACSNKTRLKKLTPQTKPGPKD